MGSFEGVRSSLCRRVMNITLRCCNASPQNLLGNVILPYESRTFDPDIAVHTVISNQEGLVTKVSRQDALYHSNPFDNNSNNKYYHNKEEIQMDLPISIWMYWPL